MKGFMYIILCDNETYYTGSTKNLKKRYSEHVSGKGSNYTKKYPPVELVYVEEFDRVEDAFKREKQIQGWSRKKKEALIAGDTSTLKKLAKGKNTILPTL